VEGGRTVTTDRSGTTEDAEATDAAGSRPFPDRPPPPDRPGTEGYPSRAASRDGAVHANEETPADSADEQRSAVSGQSAVSDGLEGAGANEATEATDRADAAEDSGVTATAEAPAEEDTGETDVGPAGATAEGPDEAPAPEVTAGIARPEPSDAPAAEEEIDDAPRAVEPTRPEDETASPRNTDEPSGRPRPTGIWGVQDGGSSAEPAFWASSVHQPPGATETTSRPESVDRPADSPDRPVYPQVTDRTAYAFTEREYAFADVSPQQAWDMHERRAPLGTSPEQWNACIAELREALAVEGIADADVRLKGPAARFCSENPKKGFPQSEDDLRARVADHYRNAPVDERAQRADSAASTYRAAGFSEEGSKPAAPFFDSTYKLDATNEPSDYGFQLSSDDLAERFRGLEKSDPTIGWRSEHGGHYKHRHLEQVAPALHDWAGRWEDVLRRDVTIATFDRRGPSTDLDDDDWKVIDPEEQANR
jgi:hypothetical protein